MFENHRRYDFPTLIAGDFKNCMGIITILKSVILLCTFLLNYATYHFNFTLFCTIKTSTEFCCNESFKTCMAILYVLI